MSSKTDIFSRPHGGNIFEAAQSAGISPEKLIDFSASINPLGPPQGLTAMLSRNLWKIRHYPVPGSPELVSKAAEIFNVSPRMILAANGATEILDLVPRVFPPETILVPAPAYAGYAESAARNNLTVKYLLPGKNCSGLYPDLDQIESSIAGRALVFIGRPNNPTGHLPDIGKLKQMISRNQHAFFVVDESFLDFTPETTLAASNFPNVLCVYSLTKFYALPGLRLGIAMGSKRIINTLSEHVSPWSVNALAQDAGCMCLEDEAFRIKSRQEMARLKQNFVQMISEVPWLDVFPGKANFLLCRINDRELSSLELARKLMLQGMLIRPAGNFPGLDDSWFRLAVRSEQENSLLCSALKTSVQESMPCHPARVKSRTPALMILGTSSGAGKSLITAGLCRIMIRDGINVAPFKAQNMSLNSYVTADGLEIGRAQALQARACRLQPDARMNPVLLKPNSDTGSQVIVHGKPVGNMDVNQYIKYKEKLFSKVKSAYDQLASRHEAVILEGAGSPAEINLKKHDLVNMNMAGHAGAKALLVGDIDRGGVFASFVGTIELLWDWEKDLISGLLINKFRGQKDLLASAVDYTQKHTGKTVLGIIPFVPGLGLPEEDSAGFKDQRHKPGPNRPDQINIGIIDLPHISNFTDFDPLYIEPDVNISIIRSKNDYSDPLDILIIPGSKNVPSDLEALKSEGLDTIIMEMASRPDREILGICGGLQMLGLGIRDEYGLESNTPEMPGLGLLPLKTEIMPEKILRQVKTFWNEDKSIPVKGYEIHHGRTMILGKVKEPIKSAGNGLVAAGLPDMPIWGTYIHGVFDSDQFRRFWLDRARKRKGLRPAGKMLACYDIDSALDRLADIVSQSVDMKEIFRILGI